MVSSLLFSVLEAFLWNWKIQSIQPRSEDLLNLESKGRRQNLYLPLGESSVYFLACFESLLITTPHTTASPHSCFVLPTPPLLGASYPAPALCSHLTPALCSSPHSCSVLPPHSCSVLPTSLLLCASHLSPAPCSPPHSCSMLQVLSHWSHRVLGLRCDSEREIVIRKIKIIAVFLSSYQASGPTFYMLYLY